MRITDIIKKKRDGGELSSDEIKFFVKGVTKGSIPDYQTSAFLMAVYFRGMTDREISELTLSMAESGDTVDLSAFGKLSADKHSTGGVGDKTSLIVSPVAASLGLKIAKMSGRGLGHTGGTVDKLEAIPGYRTCLSADEFIGQTTETGLALSGQTGSLAPADKKLYALRDVTATVDSIPLIASSIMSKKIAAGAHNIVLDVKCGSGAFMKTPEDAEKLAAKMVSAGKLCGRNICAVITDMNKPLGNYIGNSLEITEAVRVLKNEVRNDLREVSEVLAALMVSLALQVSYEKALSDVRLAIDSGKAYNKMKEWIACQGGDISYIENPGLFPSSAFSFDILSPKDGYISEMDTEKTGLCSSVLGAGRFSVTDRIDSKAGIIIYKKTGDRVSKGDRLCTLFTDKKEIREEASGLYLEALSFSDNKPSDRPLIYKVIK